MLGTLGLWFSWFLPKILSGKPGSFREGLLQQRRLIGRGGEKRRRERDEEKNCFFHGSETLFVKSPPVLALRSGILRCVVLVFRKFSRIDMSINPQGVRISGVDEGDQIVERCLGAGIGVPGCNGCFSFIGSAVGDVELLRGISDVGELDSSGSAAFRHRSAGIDRSCKDVDSIICGEVSVPARRIIQRIGSAEQWSRIRFSGVDGRNFRSIVHVTVIGKVPGGIKRVAFVIIIPVVGDEIVIVFA